MFAFNAKNIILKFVCLLDAYCLTLLYMISESAPFLAWSSVREYLYFLLILIAPAKKEKKRCIYNYSHNNNINLS